MNDTNIATLLIDGLLSSSEVLAEGDQDFSL
jgi:hypothetical protein